MMKNKPAHTMILESASAVALWHNEISGQISDGMWENSRPFNHWQFWCRLNVVSGETTEFIRTKDLTGTWLTKRSYAISRLHQLKYEDGKYVLRERMLACGRLSRAGATSRQQLEASEYMPATLEEWKQCKASGKWEYDFVEKYYMSEITDEIATNFYTKVSYTLKDLNADLKIIKHGMSLAAQF